MPPTLGIYAQAVGKRESIIDKQIRMISCLWTAPFHLSWPIMYSNVWNDKDASEKKHIQLVTLLSSGNVLFLSLQYPPKSSAPVALHILSYVSHLFLVGEFVHTSNSSSCNIFTKALKKPGVIMYNVCAACIVLKVRSLLGILGKYIKQNLLCELLRAHMCDLTLHSL